MAEAHFTRKDTTEGARFEVTPARKAIGVKLLFLFCYGYVAIVAYFGAQMGALLPSAILWGPVLLVALIAQYGLRDKYPRVPVTLLVNRDGVRANEAFYPADSIAELLLRNMAGRGKEIWYDSRSAGSTTGAAAAAAYQNVAWGLFVRTTAGSTPAILAYGLTPDTGRALLNDVSNSLRTA